MPLVSQTIKNLVQGVSQQPAFIRYPEQLEQQVNGYSTEVDGLQKRPPTVFVKKLANLTNSTEDMLVHFINRDENEQYMVVFADNTIKVYDLDGNQQTVNIPSGLASYLATSSPRRDLQVLTVADYTFILNKNVTVKMDTSKKAAGKNSYSMAVVHTGQYGNTYTISANGQSASTTTGWGNEPEQVLQIKPNTLAANLASDMSSKISGTYAYHNAVILPNVTSGEAYDGYGGDAMTFIHSEVQKFTDLPEQAPNGCKIKVNGDPNGGEAGSYYVQYNSAEKVWEECPGFGVLTTINANTMPHALVRTGDGVFTFQTLAWDDRKVGDDDSNPVPSFVDNTLSSIFFYRNRLGFSSKENIILSESGSYYNMWMTTASDLLDTDCIDVPVTSTKVNLINYVTIYMEDLYAFSADTQFILRTSTAALSPKTASITEITQFNSSPDCQPKVTGKNMYFSTERGTYASIREYYTLQDVSAMKDAQDISSHVPNYIPSGVYEIIPSTAENVLLFMTKGDRSSIYVYKYLFSDTSRVQASWSKWTFSGTIYGCGFIANKLYLLIRRGNAMNLEVLDFATNITDFADEPYRMFFDSKKMLCDGVFDTVQEVTKWNIRVAFGYADDTAWPDNKVDVVTDDGVYHPDTPIVNGQITLDGKYDGQCIFVGTPYPFRIEFSTFYIKQNNNGSVVARTDGRTQLKYINLQYDHSGFFEVQVQQHSGNTYSYRMTSRMLGSESAKLGELQDDTGVFRFPIHAKNDDVDIYVMSSYPLPVSLVGLSWECMYTTKTRRM